MNILPNTSLEDIDEVLDYLSIKNYGSIREAHEHRIENAGWLYAMATALSKEVNRHRPPRIDGKYMAWSDSHPKHDRRTWIEQVMEGITDVGYWTWVNWQLQYGDDEK